MTCGDGGTHVGAVGAVHRLADLLGMPVVTGDGRRLGRVDDVRLVPGRGVRGVWAELVVGGLVVDGRHAGLLLGYERRHRQGPGLLRAVVRGLHRRAGHLSWDAVRTVDWDRRVVTADVENLAPLTPV